MLDQQKAKTLLGEASARSVENHMRLGLGSGSTVAACITALGRRVRDENLVLHLVVASKDSERLAETHGLPVISDELRGSLDYAIDGADFLDPTGILIKGGGGALVRERMILDAADRTVILVDASKLVDRLDGCQIPVAVVPFGWRVLVAKLKTLGAVVQLRYHQSEPFVTDDGLWILDTVWNPVPDPVALHHQLKSLPGVVDTGIFVGYQGQVWISDGGTVSLWRAP